MIDDEISYLLCFQKSKLKILIFERTILRQMINNEFSLFAISKIKIKDSYFRAHDFTANDQQWNFVFFAISKIKIKSSCFRAHDFKANDKQWNFVILRFQKSKLKIAIFAHDFRANDQQWNFIFFAISKIKLKNSYFRVRF